MSDKEDAGEKKPNGADDGKPNISPEAQVEIDKFKKQAEDERTARVAAEKRASDATTAVASANKTVQDTELQLVTTAIDTCNTAIDSLKSRYKEALASQDYDAASDINVEISKATNKLQLLENGKGVMEEERKQPPRREEQPQRRVFTDAEKVDAVAKDLAPWPRSAAWVRSHPEYILNDTKNAEMQAAHYGAVAKGIVPDSDQYFEFVEKQLGFRPGAAEGDAEALSGAGRGKGRDSGGDKGPPGLPPGGGGGGGNSRRLTPLQKEIAKMNGMTDEEYAKNLDELKAEGRIH